MKTFNTFSDLIASIQTKTESTFVCTERAGAEYVLQAVGYTALVGDATFANGRVAALQSTENVRSYGTIGATDCSAVIQLATNSGRSDKYNFRGTFKVDVPTLTSGISNLTLDCEGAYFDCSTMYGADVSNNLDALFKIFGSEYGATTLVADGAVNSTTLLVADGTQIKLGSEIYILSDEHWYSDNVTSVGRRFITTVTNISTNTLTISDPLPFSFTASGYTISVESWNSIENINVIGGEFFGGNYRRDLGNGVGIGVVECKYFRNLKIKGFTVNGFESIAFKPHFGKTAIIESGTIQGHTNSFGTVTEGVNSGFYGVFFSRVLTGRMDKVTGTRCRHLQDSASSFDLKVTNNTSYMSHRPGFGCHNGTFDTTYTDCSNYGEIGGIQWRGFNLYVDGFICRTGNSGSNGIYDTTGAAADLPSVRIITNPDIIAGRAGIKLSGNISIAQIAGGTVIGGAQDSGYFPVDIATDYIEYATVSTYMEQFSGSGVCFFQSSSSIVNMKMIKITDSYLKSDNNLARFAAGAGIGSVWIEQNVFDSSAAGFDININNAQNFERVNANFRPDGTPATRN